MEKIFSKRIFFLVSALVAVSCILLIAQSQPAALILHFLLGKFLYSTSNGAVLFFLILYVVAALTAFIWPVRTIKPKYIYLWVLPAVLLLGNFINIWSFFAYQRQLELPLKIPFYHWLDKQNSFCYLLHNHTGKTPLAFLVQLFGIQEQMAAFDTGQVFYSHVSAFVPWFLAVLLLSALGLFFFSLLQILQRYQYNIFVFILYFLSFSGCLKSMVDGGPFTYRFFPSFFVLMSLIAATDAEALVKLWLKRWWIVFICAILPLIILWQYLSPERWTSALAPFIFLCFSFLILLLLVKSKKGRLTRVAIAVSAIYLLLSIGVEYLFFDVAFFQKIRPNVQVVKVDFDDFTVRDVSTDSQGLKVYEAYIKYGNDPLKPDNLFIWNNAEAGLRSMDLLLKPLEYVGDYGRIPEQNLLLFQHPEEMESLTQVLRLTIVSAAMMPPVFSRTHATLFSRNNYYCYLHVLGHLFTAAGIKEFIVVPLPGARI